MKRKKLIKLLARICYNAQGHTFGWDDEEYINDYELIFQCTSYTVACFLANNTVEGKHGVDTCVDYIDEDGKRSSVLDLLCIRDFDLQKEDWWKKKIAYIIDIYNNEVVR